MTGLKHGLGILGGKRKVKKKGFDEQHSHPSLWCLIRTSQCLEVFPRLALVRQQRLIRSLCLLPHLGRKESPYGEHMAWSQINNKECQLADNFEMIAINICFLKVCLGRSLKEKSSSVDSITTRITSDRRPQEKQVCFQLCLRQRNSPSSEINGGFQSCWHCYFIIHMTQQTINLAAMYGNEGKEQISHE